MKPGQPGPALCDHVQLPELDGATRHWVGPSAQAISASRACCLLLPQVLGALHHRWEGSISVCRGAPICTPHHTHTPSPTHPHHPPHPSTPTTNPTTTPFSHTITPTHKPTPSPTPCPQANIPSQTPYPPTLPHTHPYPPTSPHTFTSDPDTEAGTPVWQRACILGSP